MIGDYLSTTLPPGIEGLVANPPFRRAHQFIEKAMADRVPYVAMLLRGAFLFESESRGDLLEKRFPPTRVYLSAPRLPMMHRVGWTGKRASSNMGHAWVFWDQRNPERQHPARFNWREICALPRWRVFLARSDAAVLPAG